MTEQNHLGRVWEIIDNVGVCMLTTQFAGGLRARPIEARTDRDVGLIFVVTDVSTFGMRTAGALVGSPPQAPPGHGPGPAAR